jgi:hypothetical protein
MLESLSGLDFYPRSIVADAGCEYGLVRTGDGNRLAVLGEPSALLGLEGESGEHRGQSLLLGPTSPRNAAALRARLPWLQARPLGLLPSAGMGDRIGLATPGHVRAVRAFGGQIAPIFAQQSIREMKRTDRTPQEVMDDALWGIFEEGWRDGAGADADHLKTPSDIDACLACGYTLFTIDPGDYVDNHADTADGTYLWMALQGLPWTLIEDDYPSLVGRYACRSFDVEGTQIDFPELTILRAAAKYGRALGHITLMARHLAQAAGGRDVEMEVSVDETDTPTTHAEHLYIARELKRLGIHCVSLAPRYVGRFEKGIDYIGDPEAFEADIAVHAAIARQFGPYKLSLHTGSDKFSIYPAVMRQTRGLVHLKTAGTSYLEALRTAASVDPALFRDIYAFARTRFEDDRATYLTSARVERTPEPNSVPDDQLAQLLDNNDARQILHITFGSVLRDQGRDGYPGFHDRLMGLLGRHREDYARNVEAHFLRHLAPFVAEDRAL